MIFYRHLATTKKAVELFEDIIHRFGLPNSIITTSEPRLLAITFGISTKIGASLLNTSPLPIREPMAKLSGRTA